MKFQTISLVSNSLTHIYVGDALKQLNYKLTSLQNLPLKALGLHTARVGTLVVKSLNPSGQLGALRNAIFKLHLAAHSTPMLLKLITILTYAV